MDRADPLASLRGQFEIPDDLIYLDGNSLGVLPKKAPERLKETLERDWGIGLVRSWNDAHWMALPEKIGSKIARLIGAQPGEVVATDSTSVNLFKVLCAALRLCGQGDRAEYVIVSERENFPTDLYVAQGLLDLLNDAGACRYRLQLTDSTAGLREAISARPAVVMLTQVNYKTGALHDLNEVTALAHEAGAVMIWDLAHSAGALPVDLHRAQADFAVGCGYKYLNGGPGAPAFVFVAQRHQERFWQPLSGWIGHAQPFAFEPLYQPAAGISRYLCGTPPILSMVALDVGLDTVLAAEPLGGMAAIRAKSSLLADLFIGLVQAHCPGESLALITPRDAAARGSQVSFVASAELMGGYALMQALIAEGVIGDFRAPNVLRFGLTPLYTRFVDIWDAVEKLRSLLETGAWDRPAFHRKAAVT